MKMTQSTKILSYLGKNQANPGVTTAAVSKGARVPKGSVSQRISDLREEGHRIFTNYRKVKGSNTKKAYYRLYA
jgi:hypothetical protein